LLILAMVGAAPWGIGSTTWLVDNGGGGDFIAIQAAIDAASHGDVILVRPGSPYSNFVVDKSVRVLSEDGATRYEVQDVNAPVAMIRFISPVLGIASISDVQVTGLNARVVVTECTGEVALDNVLVDGSVGNNSNNPFDRRLTITNCSNVSISESVFSGRPGGAGFGNDLIEAVAYIQTSTVRMTDVVVLGSNGENGEHCFFDCGGLADGRAADHGLEAWSNSFVVLAGCEIRGGAGGFGGSYPINFFEVEGGNGGAGGRGLWVRDSEVQVLGDAGLSYSIEGGPGGDGYTNFVVNCPSGGGGGAAITMVSAGTTTQVTQSRMNVAGGAGGDGCVLGTMGAAVSGSGLHSADDSFPFLTLGDLRIGQNTTLAVDGVHTGVVLFLISDTAGFDFAQLPNYGGPPVSAVFGSFGLLTLAFLTNGSGDLSLTAPLCNEPALVGLPLTIQAALNGGPGMNHRSNAVTRVIGQ
jgi:hypothetical protein